MASLACVACGATVSVASGRPRVTVHGVVLVCRAACRPARAATVPPPSHHDGGSRRSVLPATIALGVAALAIGALAYRGSAAASAAPLGRATLPVLTVADGDLDLPGPLGRVQGHVVVAPSESPPPSALGMAFDHQDAIDLVWYHPLAGDRRLPTRGDRRFGAVRAGTRPAECGRGHCGVDLGDTVGEVVHAALPGVVRYVDRSAEGGCGRYVVLDHPGGFSTYYFHLDRVHPSLVPEIEVAAGEPIGTLGATGIVRSAPHLHFQVARRDERGHRFVDPEPMLRRAILLDEPAPMPADRRPPASVPVPAPSPDELALADE
jgi:murein DD-endopeptidase MepM/ murein hydrolase activator NlpD